MAELSIPIALLPPAARYVQGVVPVIRYSGTRVMGVRTLPRDWRLAGDTLGVIQDRAMVKSTPSSPETPFAKGRVWLLRLADGYKAWEGWSDAQGWYSARGLEVGVEYIAVGIDPYRDHKATGAGPVMAVKETP